MYLAIDSEKTGIKLKCMLKMAGYDVKFIQEYLHLSCPQSIYRWFKGKALPSVENLCALSRLLGVHMEELLVLQGQAVGDRANGVTGDISLKEVHFQTFHWCSIAGLPAIHDYRVCEAVPVICGGIRMKRLLSYTRCFMKIA